MEKFNLLAAGLDSTNSQLRLSLPAAKLFQPYAIKGGEPELKVKELITSAVNQGRCKTFHQEPSVDRYRVPRSLRQILTNLDFPLCFLLTVPQMEDWKLLLVLTSPLQKCCGKGLCLVTVNPKNVTSGSQLRLEWLPGSLLRRRHLVRKFPA